MSYSMRKRKTAAEQAKEAEATAEAEARERDVARLEYQCGFREPMSKTLRFEVFKRDAFTCQYCGRKPPEVALEADHIKPVCDGGETAIENLLTSCFDCNRGKGSKSLSDVAPRPDADLMAYEIEQEIAELRYYNEVVQKREQMFSDVIELISRRWATVLGSDFDIRPPLWNVESMIAKYGPEITIRAMEALAHKLKTGALRDNPSSPVKYLYGILKRMETHREKVRAGSAARNYRRKLVKDAEASGGLAI